MYGQKHTYYLYKLPNTIWFNFDEMQLSCSYSRNLFATTSTHSFISTSKRKHSIPGFEDAHLYTQRCLRPHEEMLNSKKQHIQQNILQLETHNQ